MDIAAVLIALVTLAAGVAVGWAFARARTRTDETSTATALATLRAERDAAVAARDQVAGERDAAEVGRRTAELQATEAATRLEALEQAEAQLTDTFARLSNEALARNNKQFLEIADDRFKQAGRPLTETLDKVELQLRQIEKERAGAHRALTEQIEFVRKSGDELRHETAALVSALRKPQARGRWGELQLKRCIELAGMTERCDFYEQTSISTSEGVIRPDVLIRLVGDKNIVVDSKVTLAAYLEAYEATDDNVRAERLAAHARHLRQHVNDLAGKAYWSQFSPSPEFVILFVPGDPFLAAALDADPALIDDAFTKKVHIATPTTLISTLRTIAYTWQQQALADNARKVFDLGRELYKRIGTMGGHVDKLGRSLTRAVNDYNATVGSLESQVMSSARKLNEIEVIDEPLVELSGLDATVRPLTKPELIESADAARSVVALPAGGDTSFEPDRSADYGVNAGEQHEDRRTGS